MFLRITLTEAKKKNHELNFPIIWTFSDTMMRYAIDRGYKTSHTETKEYANWKRFWTIVRTYTCKAIVSFKICWSIFQVQLLFFTGLPFIFICFSKNLWKIKCTTKYSKKYKSEHNDFRCKDITQQNQGLSGHVQSSSFLMNG
jgi:hypothetical protein